MHYPKLNFTRFFTSIAIAIAIIFIFIPVRASVNAATGINRQINFQGKLVNNPAATNVTNTSYTVVFTLYNNPNVGQGTALWTETQTVTTVDGIFRVALGSVTAFPANFNFNWSGLYLGMKVNADSEMTPRIQMAAVPFAFNSERVAGLTVQDTSGNASTSGTLQIANAKTVNLGTQNLTFTTSADTTLTLPTTGTLLTNTTAVNQTITSTQTTGSILSLADSTGLSGAITGIAITLSGTGVQDQTGLSFNLSGASGTNLNDIVGTGSSWKVSKAGALTVASCVGCGGAGGYSPFAELTGVNGGVIVPNNSTMDLLIGGQSTASAKFAFMGMAGTQTPTASISGNLSLAVPTGANPTALLNVLNGGSLNFQTSVGGGAGLLTRLFIANNGNIGIGTTAPSFPLDVETNADYNASAYGINSSLNYNGSQNQVADNRYRAGLFNISVNGSKSLNTSYETIAPIYAQTTLNMTGFPTVNEIAGLTSSLYATGTNNTNVNLYTGIRSLAYGSAGSTTNIGTLDWISAGYFNSNGTLNITTQKGIDLSGMSTAGTTFGIDIGNFTASTSAYGLRIGALTAPTKYAIITDPNAGNVGIGTTAPADRFHVVDTQGAITSVKNAIQSQIAWTPTADEGTWAVRGGQFQVIKAGAFNVTSQIGLRGLQNSVVNMGSGNISEAAGFLGIVQNTGTGTIANAYGAYIFTPTAALANPITSAYGLYVNAQTTTGVTTGYGVYAAGTSDINYFGGNVGIGTISPTALLHVNGGYSNNAAMIVNNLNSGNLFTASASGVTKFTIGNTGTVTAPFYNTCTLKTDTAGLISCGSDNVGSSTNWWNQLGGVLSPVDIGYDFAIGSSATSSAKFSFTGVKTGQTIASVSGVLNLIANNGWGGELRIFDNNNNYTGFRAPSDLTGTSNYIYTLPSNYGTNGQFMSTNGSGGFVWSSGATPAVDMGTCQERRTTNYTLTASFADVTLDATDIQNNTNVCQHDGTNTARINISESGLYALHYHADIAQGTTANDYSFQIVQNAATVINGSALNGKNSSTDKTVVSTTTYVTLTAEDYIRVQAKFPAATGGLVANLVFSATRMAGPRGAQGIAGANGAFTELNGAIVSINSTEDLLVGGQSTASAKFAFMGMAGTQTPTASISGNLSLAVPTGANPTALLNVLNGGSLNFQTSVGGGAGLLTRLFIANNGNIGIGTTAPGEKLDISGGNAIFDDTFGIYSRANGVAAGSMMLSADTTGTILRSADNDPTDGIRFQSYDGTTRMYIGSGSTYAGNVGIGTTSPLLRLDAYDSTVTNSVAVIKRGIQSDDTGDSALPTTFGIPYLRIGDKEYRTGAIQTISFGNSYAGGIQPIEIGAVTTDISDYSKGDIVFAARNGTTNVAPSEVMRITSAGNVGIGTTNPQAKLDIGGSTSTISNSTGDIIITPAGNLVVSSGTLAANGGITFDQTSDTIGSYTLGGGILGNSQNITALSGMTINAGGLISSATSGTLGIGTTTNTTGLTIGNSGATSGLTLNVDTAAHFVFQKEGSAYQCSGTDKLTLNSSGQLVCGTDQTGGGGGGYSPFQEITGVNGGVIAPNNSTMDFLIGGQSSSSASFRVTGASPFAGTLSVASIAANTSFAAFVIDQNGTGDFLTASASGLTKFTITKAGGISASDGITIDKTGSNDIVKTTSGNNQKDTDFQRTANSTTASLTNIDNSGGEISLGKGTVSSNGTISTGGPTAQGAIGAGAHSITRSDGKYLIVRGGSTALDIYDSLSNSFRASILTLTAAAGAGSVSIPRPDGKYLVVHGGGVATTSVVEPKENVPVVAGPTATGTNSTGTNIYRRQNGQYLLIHGGAAGTSRVYNPVANTFAAGPIAGSTTWAAGSLVLPRQNGTALIVAGGATANTQVYNLDGAAGIGSFTAGPVLPTNCEINNAGSVALQLANGRYIILSKANVSVEYDPVNNTMGTCQSVGPANALADGAHAIRLQDRRFLILGGSGTTNAYIYDPATNTYSTHATATSTQGAGLHSLQRHDGTWLILAGGGTTTNTYDTQLLMNGSYTSEDINNNSLNPSSTLWFTAGAESLFSGTSSATLVGDLPQSGLEISVQTSSTQGGLSSATERKIYRNGELIRAGASDKWIRVSINFSRPIPQQIYDERRTWVGNGMTNITRDYQDPTLYDYMIDNSTVLVRNQFDFVDSQGIQDPTEASASALTRVQAMSDRVTLPWGKVPGPTQISTNAGFYLGSIGVHPPLLAPTADGTLVIQRPGGLISIIASGSANMSLYDPASSVFTAQSGAGNIPTTLTGRGAFALKLPSGEFLIVIGSASATTNIFNPNAASGSQFRQGPNLSGLAGFGAQPILNTDGTYTILHGNGLKTSTLFNPFTDAVKPSSDTLPVGPVTTIDVNCGAWAIPLQGQRQDTYRVFAGVGLNLAGITTSMTYDSVAKVFAAGPTQTGAHGCGSYAFQRQDGYWVSIAAAGGAIGAQSTATQIINPWSNTNLAGPTLTAAAGRGSVVIPRADGTFLITRGQTQSINGNGTNIYIPWGGTFGVGAGIGTMVAGPNMIDYSATPGTVVSGTGAVTFQRPDGKWVIIAGGHTDGSNIVNLYDAGWYPDGQYQSGQIYTPTLSTNSTMSWKKTTDDYVDFQVRTSPTKEALLTDSFHSVSHSGDSSAADSGDDWLQVQINFSRRFTGYSGIYSDIWQSGGALPAMMISQPTVFEYRVNNAYDFLTLKNDGLNMFRVNKYGAIYSGIQGGFYTGGADLAENYSSKETLIKGEVVSIDGKSGDHNIKKSSGQYETSMLGVVSTNPGFVAGDGTEDAYPVALVGRVPVKISTENGQIREGDALTSASIPGYAMKATVAGRVLGKVLQSFDESKAEECPALGMGNVSTTKCGVVMLFVNLVDYNGQSVDVAMRDAGFTFDKKDLPAIAGLDFNTDKDAYRQQEVLGFLKAQKDFGQGIFTDRIAVTQEIISPQIITDLLVAKIIRADHIEGLEIFTNRISALETNTSVLGNSTKSAEITSQFAQLPSTLTLSSLNVEGLATVSADLNVKGNSLVEGMLDVLDTISTPKLLVSDFASFFGNVFFKKNVNFEGRTTFNNDTAGFAEINKGDQSVTVEFDEEYNDTPVITASIAFDKIEAPVRQKLLEDAVLEGNVSYIITKRTTKGFTIKLNRPAEEDISFSWVALSVKNAKIKSKDITPTPNPLATQSAGFQSILNQLNNSSN